MSSKDSFVRDAVELRLVFALLLLMAVLIVQGCTAFNPQGAAIQQTKLRVSSSPSLTGRMGTSSR